MRGLNKAEVHKIKVMVRASAYFTALDVLKMPGAWCRVAMQEVRKRRWHYSVNRAEWQSPRFRDWTQRSA